MHAPPDPQTRRAALAGDPEAKRDKHRFYINVPVDLQILIVATAPWCLAVLLIALGARP